MAKKVAARGTPGPALIFSDNGSCIYVTPKLGGSFDNSVTYTKVQAKFNCMKCSSQFSTRRKFLIHLFNENHLQKIICNCNSRFTYTTFQEHIKKTADCKEFLENDPIVPENLTIENTAPSNEISAENVSDESSVNEHHNESLVVSDDIETEEINDYISWCGSPKLPRSLMEKLQRYNEKSHSPVLMKEKKSKAKIPIINIKPSFRFAGVSTKEMENSLPKNPHLQFYFDLKKCIEEEHERVMPDTVPSSIDGVKTLNVEKRIKKIKPKANNTKLRVLSKLRQLLKYLNIHFNLTMEEFHIGLMGYSRLYQLYFKFQFDSGYEISTISNSVDDFKYIVRFLKNYHNIYKSHYFSFYTQVFDFLCAELINANKIKTRKPVPCFAKIGDDCVSIAQLNIEEGANLDDEELAALFAWLVNNFNHIQSKVKEIYDGNVNLLKLPSSKRFQYLIFLYECQLMCYHLVNCAFLGQRTQILQQLTYTGFSMMSDAFVYHPSFTEKCRRKDQVIALPKFAYQVVQVQYIVRQAIVTVCTNHQMEYKKFPDIQYSKTIASDVSGQAIVDLQTDKFPICESRLLFVNFSGKISIDSAFEVDCATFFQYRYNKDIHITPSQTHRRNIMSKMNLGKLEDIQLAMEMESFEFRKIFFDYFNTSATMAENHYNRNQFTTHSGRIATAISKFSFGANHENMVDESCKFSELETRMIKKIDNSLITKRRIRNTYKDDLFIIEVPGKPPIQIQKDDMLCHKIVDNCPYFQTTSILETITKDYTYANKGEYFENICGKKILSFRSLNIIKEGCEITSHCYSRAYESIAKHFPSYVARVPSAEENPKKKFKIW